jgi:hypothetical protein
MYLAVSRAKIRAKEMGLALDITDADLMVPEFFPVFGTRLEFNHQDKAGPTDNSPSVDRIRRELGYTKGNVRVISNRANRLRSDATVKELKPLILDEESRQ